MGTIIAKLIIVLLAMIELRYPQKNVRTLAALMFPTHPNNLWQCGVGLKCTPIREGAKVHQIVAIPAPS